MHFGQTLRVLRTTAGISLRSMARTVGISATYLSHIETGKLAPPAEEKIRRIGQVLGVPDGYLMSMTTRLDSVTTEYMARTPEAVEFLHAAATTGLSGADLLQLAAVIQGQPLARLRELLRAAGDEEPPHTAPRLYDYLDEQHVCFLSRVGTQSRLFDVVAERIVADLPGVPAATVAARLHARESDACTGIGCGVAVPHATLPELKCTAMLLAILPDGVDYHAIDGEPVTLCFVFVGGSSDNREHLGLLARTARLCSHDEFRAGILKTRTPAAALAYIRETSGRIG